MVIPAVVCLAGSFSETQSVPQTADTCFCSWISVCPVHTCIQKRPGAVRALVVHNAGRGTVESSFPCLGGSHYPFQMLTLSHTPASAASASRSPTLRAAVRVSGSRRFSSAFLSVASFVRARLRLHRVRHMRGARNDDELCVMNKYSVG